MRLVNFGIALCLVVAAPASVFAQTPVMPGKWELTSTYKGVPFGGDGERTRTVCLSAETLGALPEKALIQASPPPSDDASSLKSPKCEYSQVRRDGASSAWTVSCEEPKMAGNGSATMLSPEQVDLQETLELKMGFMARSIQHGVRARRVGDCS
ncbi:hypothetical protein DBR23_29045 [Acidovorax sp. HMWF018]|nr:hypothetical protein DBR23_29045 [Acidovorax sp. HMWF018]